MVRVLLLLTFFLSVSCVSQDIDRTLVNDPIMVNNSDNYLPVSPFSGLKTRNRSTGGNACSTCAH